MTENSHSAQIIEMPESASKGTLVLDNARHWIVVVGAGAGSAEFVKALSDRAISQGKQNKLGIVVLDPRPSSEDGRGVAWSSSQNTELRANMTLDSIARGSDTVRLAFDGLYTPEQLDGQMFKKRVEMGEKLAEQFQSTLRDLREASIGYHRIETEVESIRERGRMLEVFHENGSVIADKVVLATGHIPPTNFSHLFEEEKYVPNPWDWEVLQEVGADDTVCLIGMGPTAVDVAISLRELGHTGRIEAFTRSGLMQYPRCRYRSHELKVYTEANIAELARLNGYLSLDMVKSLIVAEFSAAGVGIEGLIEAITNSSNRPYQSLPLGIAAAGEERSWFSILKALDDVTALTWHLFSEDAKNQYLRQWRKAHTNVSYGMASVQAQKIHIMMQDGQLSIIKGEPTITPSRNRFRIEVGGEAEPRVHQADWVINCSGVGTRITESRVPLYQDLLQSGFFQPHPHGGIYCDFDTGKICDTSANPIAEVYTLVGSLNYGVRLLTHCYAEVVKSAERTADAIIASA